jgi:predicted ABC-type exoprotein transport system permease subunit
MNDIIRMVVANGGVALLLVVLVISPLIYYIDGVNTLKNVFIALTIFGIMIAIVGVVATGLIEHFA